MIIPLTEDLWVKAYNSGGNTINLFGFSLEADENKEGVKFFEVYEPGESDYKVYPLGTALQFEYSY